MVRRDVDEEEGVQAPEDSAARCISPAGENPVSVSAGAPSSRPQASEGDPGVRAGRQEPVSRKVSGEQARGPQHEVKPAASTDQQSRSRAAHVTAKATPVAPVPERAMGPGGVRGAARVQGGMRNTRGPSQPPSSRQGASYKSKTKSATAERESEGTIVVSRAAPHNAAGAKGPCGDHVDGGGKREGMAGRTGSNHPHRRPAKDKVRQLRRRLWVAAKRSPTRRSTRSMTASTGVTSCGKRGDESERTAARLGSMRSRSRTWSSTASISSSKS